MNSVLGQVGYGAEDDHFVCELTYNYGVSTYKLGNDFLGLTIKSSQVLANAKSQDWPVHDDNGTAYLEMPGGYRFYVLDEEQPIDRGLCWLGLGFFAIRRGSIVLLSINPA